MPSDILRFLLVVAIFLSASGRILVAGDILRGGASAGSGRQAAEARANAGAAAAEVAKAKAADRLSRTTQVINAMRQMQAAANSVAAAGVPDGLVTGGLEVLAGASAQWTGASAPVQSGNQVTIKQTDQQALLKWKTFNVGKSTSVYFDQQSGGADAGKWIAFNKISDPSGKPSQILGSIKADGQVYLINQNGIVFGAGSQVSTRIFVASALPINDTLIERGLLNQTAKDVQFLFTSGGADAGNVEVKAGATIQSSEQSEGSGGRIVLVGKNVTNAGTLSAPAGQTILASGLEVGFAAHDTSDAGLRGLDVYIGNTGGGGVTTNTGLVDIPRGSAWFAGRTVDQSGVINSTTSVSLNGRVDLTASYDSVINTAYDPAVASTGLPFLAKSSGLVQLGGASLIRILPESTEETKTGTTLALRSQINVQGRSIYAAQGATVLAPNAKVSIEAGNWLYSVAGSQPSSTFAFTGGQVYLDSGSLIDVSGVTGVDVAMDQNILEIELRGSELADSPIQRTGAIRGIKLIVDARKTGTYNGKSWVGTPLGDISGYVGLVQRSASQLMTAGGSVSISAGESVIVRDGASVDVSGGWVRNLGGKVRTTRLIRSGNLVDISDATPDMLYDGVYSGTSTISHSKWGITKSYVTPLSPDGSYNQKAYIQGADGGDIALSAPSIALDGSLEGQTVVGPHQMRSSAVSSSLPKSAGLELAFHGQDSTTPSPLTTYFPTRVVVTSERSGGISGFQVDASGTATPIDVSRRGVFELAPALSTSAGFARLAILNEEGDISVPEGAALETAPGGSIRLAAANIDIQGKVLSPGGSVSLTAYNISPYQATVIGASANPVTPSPNTGKGVFMLGANAVLSAAGTIVDDRATAPVGSLTAMAPNGGDISIAAYAASLSDGGIVDASGGILIGANGRKKYGNGGSISIKAGQDPGVSSVFGGQLTLKSDLRGFAGGTAGSLTLQGGVVEIGDFQSYAGSLWLQPSFFSSGGFGSFTVIGLGSPSAPEIPAVSIAAGTILTPKATSLVLSRPSASGAHLLPIERAVDERTPVSLSFLAPGVFDSFTNGLVRRGDLVLGEGAEIRTDPEGKVTLSGNTVAVLGSIFAPGGEIQISGGMDSTRLFADQSAALVTTYIGPRSVLSAAGSFVPSSDPFGRKTGDVLAGGSIKISGNIFAAAGSLLDVSGASEVVDLSPALASLASDASVPAYSGLTQIPESLRVIPVRVDSDAGTITLQGGQLLRSSARLLGYAGGSDAAGGTLVVSSGRFYPVGSTSAPTDTNLTVYQSSETVRASASAAGASAIGKAVSDATGGTANGGRFGVDHFTSGGFDSLSLKGVVYFSGPVRIDARASISVADSGVLSADSAVVLSAPYVSLGIPFQTPVLPADQTSPFATPVAATSGSGSLSVFGRLVDLGTLSLQQIGSAFVEATNGDIRGSGVFNMAGDLTLKAGQIYPITASTFTIIVSDDTSGATVRPGRVTILPSGIRSLPLSAGGTLEIYASQIDQWGVIRAPFGEIVLGWDGGGTAPTNLLSGASVPVAESVLLGRGSVTSVSAIDPLTGAGVTIPYGVSADGNSWIDPRGVDVTTSGLAGKSITISSKNLTTESGSTIDIRGGGDLLAYRWVEGSGGTQDILGSDTRFAILPGTGYEFAPYAPFNSSSSSDNLIANSGTGYANASLKVGDSIYVSGSKSLAAGYYTLLPARYAILPGAVLVTPVSGTAGGTVETSEGSSLVSGFRYNALDSLKQANGAIERFELLAGTALAARAEYSTYLANTFVAGRATDLGVSTQRLPQDAGYLLLQATQSMDLAGSVFAASLFAGRGGTIDIDTSLDILISETASNSVAGRTVFRSSLLSSWDAESLLIGGRRIAGTASTTIDVTAGSITVDNAGSPLSGYEIVLVANKELTVAPGGAIIQSGTGPAAMEDFVLSGHSSLSAGNSLTVSRGGGSIVFPNGTSGSGRVVASVAGTIVAANGTTTSFSAGAPVSLAAGSSIVLSAAGTVSLVGGASGESVPVVSSDGALLRVTGDASATQSRTSLAFSSGPSLTVGAGARISGVAVTLDSSASTAVDSTAFLLAGTFSISAGRVNIDLDGSLSAVPAPPAGLLLGGTVLQNVLSAGAISIRSYSSLNFFGSGDLGTSSLENLTLSAGQLNNAGAGSVRILAGLLRLDNANAGDASVEASPTGGTLDVESRNIVFGKNSVAINRFSSVSFSATESISGDGTGGVTSQTDLALLSPLLTGAAGSDHSYIASGGALSVRNPTGAAAGSGEGALGATLALTGSSVDIASDISLRSGLVSVRAVSGPLTVSGTIDVSGTARTFYDVVKYTDAGEVKLVADAGNITLAPGSLIDVSAADYGNAGTLTISAPHGVFQASGSLDAAASSGYASGSFSLDILSLPDLSVYSDLLTAAHFSESQSFRVRGDSLVAGSGDVIITGTSVAKSFSLSADLGSISVGDSVSGAVGILNASGETGGSISLQAHGDVTINAGSLLTVRGQTFSSSGKGGSINLESGTQLDGAAGTGRVGIRSGSTLDLGVDARVVLNSNPATDVLTVGSSAYNGRFSGKLAIRAPQNSGATDVLVDAINGTIIDASSITVEGYRIFDLTNTGGLITNSGAINASGGLMSASQNVQESIRQNGISFLGSSGSASAGYTSMLARLLANNGGLSSVFVLTPGAEIINRNGNLTLGSTSSTTTSDWNFVTNSASTTFRFGPKSAPGVLTMRASGNLVFYNALSDGFTPTLASSDTTWLWLARLSTQNTNLPVNTQSWTFRLTAGADLAAADYRRLLPLSSLSSTSGYFQLGKNNGLNVVSNVTSGAASSSAQTSAAIANRFQVIRTGSGDIDISAGRSIQILNQFSTIYTAGTRVTNPTLNGTFDTPTLLQNDQSGTSDLGSPQQYYPALYSMAGGNVSLYAQQNIERLTTVAGQTIADSQFQMPDNWLYRRGYVDENGSFAQLNIGNVLTYASTTWWIDFSNFFQGVGALGGGDVSLVAGANVSNVDAVIPTNARMSKGTPDAANLLELGGGDLLVKAGSDIDAGVYYVERGQGTLVAGRSIKTNSTREVTNGATSASGLSDSATWLPTTLFLGKGGFDVSARGSVILGPVANVFLLPGGLANTYRYKTYFSTYASSSYVNVTSIGGSITLREEAAVGGSVSGMLEEWFQNKLLWTPASPTSASYARPWLRLNESNVQFFGTVASLLPPVIRATSFSDAINLAGDLTLSPSASGTLELLSQTAISGLNKLSSSGSATSGYSVVNVSDASPDDIPGIASPFAYQKIAAVIGSPSRTSDQNFLQFLDDMFIESGATAGSEASLEARLARHSASKLHSADTSPLRLYSVLGDISGLTLFSPKTARVIAGRDISDISFYIQNLSLDDISVVAAGRDILPYNSSSLLRTSLSGAPTVALPGDIQTAGPGTVEVLAGRDLDLGTGASLTLSWKVSSADGSKNVVVTANTAKQALAKVQALTDARGKALYPWAQSTTAVSLLTVSDGIGAGIATIGNARNPFLSNEGANIVAAAGVGSSSGLAQSSLNFESLLQNASVQGTSDESRAYEALPAFFKILRDAGRAAASGEKDGYAAGFEAISGLFPGSSSGDMLLRSRDIRTKSGGDIFLLIPGGGLTLANTSIYETVTPPGIITESGGSISIFANAGVDIGIGRIFTLRGGNEIIWASTGNIAAGASSKTVASAPPTRVLLDPQSAELETDLAGLATGGGIGVLATVAGVAPGDVDLIAPAGVVDAGDAGIRVTGNLNIAATAVLNAGNIAAGGTTAGVPSAPTVAAPNIGGLTSGSSSSAAANAAAQAVADGSRQQQAAEIEDTPSIIQVQVLGYGGGEEDEGD